MRIACCVPFCRRTYHNREGYDEWICREHWTMTDKSLRKRKSDLHRRAKRKGWTMARKLIASHLWEELKCQAIERAAGI